MIRHQALADYGKNNNTTLSTLMNPNRFCDIAVVQAPRHLCQVLILVNQLNDVKDETAEDGFRQLWTLEIITEVQGIRLVNTLLTECRTREEALTAMSKLVASPAVLLAQLHAMTKGTVMADWFI